MQNTAQSGEANFLKISELNFKAISSSLGSVLQKGKAAFLSKGVLKKLAKSIEEENASYIKVIIGETFTTRMLASDDSGYDIYIYKRLKTEDGSIIDFGVQLIEKFEPSIGSQAYLLQFKIKKDIRYIIVESIEEEYLFNNTKHLSEIDTNDTNITIIPELREKGLLDKGIESLASKFFK